jgi:hypothetical protein
VQGAERCQQMHYGTGGNEMMSTNAVPPVGTSKMYLDAPVPSGMQVQYYCSGRKEFSFSTAGTTRYDKMARE